MPKVRVSYRLEEDADNIIRKLSDSWGVSQAQVIEILAREAKGRELKTTRAEKTRKAQIKAMQPKP